MIEMCYGCGNLIHGRLGEVRKTYIRILGPKGGMVGWTCVPCFNEGWVGPYEYVSWNSLSMVIRAV